MEEKCELLYQALKECCQKYHADVHDDLVLQATAIFVFPEKYIGFAGHFPGHPVLPAIVQLALVRYLAECVLGSPLMPVQYKRIKFRAMIQPEERVLVLIDFTRSGNNWSGSFLLERADKVLVAGGSVEFSLVA